MKQTLTLSLALPVVACLSLALGGTGCKSEEPAPATPVEVGTFTGQSLPETVEKLEGTPLYSSSKEISGLAKFNGAAYLLIAPQDPTKALIVVEPGANPEEVSQRPSQPITLAGSRDTVEGKELASQIKERYQLDLQTTADGKVETLLVKTSPAGSTPAATPAETPAGE